MSIAYVKGVPVPLGGGSELPHKILTQAKYDMLTDEEKANGVYFIPEDIEVFGGGGLTQYSEEEIVVGVYTDGKPVYRKCVTINTGEPSEEVAYVWSCMFKNLSVPSLEIETLIRFDGLLRAGNNRWSLPLSNMNPSNEGKVNESVHMIINHGGLGLTIYRYNGTSASYCNRDVLIILEYTKTTDQATTFSLPRVHHPDRIIEGEVIE